MPITPNGPAPYPPTGQVLAVIQRHRNVGLPTPITTEVIERVTGTPGLAPRIMRALALFDLVDNDGNTTPQFEELAKAPSEADFKERLASVIRAAYADVFQYVDPATASPEHLEGQFRNYTPRGQVGRMVGLFRGLCEYVGIIPEGQGDWNGKPPPERTRTPRARSAKNGDRPKREKAGKASDTIDDPSNPPPPPPRAGIENPILKGLFEALPPIPSDWPTSKAEFPEQARQAWLDAAKANFAVLYKLAPDDAEGGDSD